MNSCSFVPLHCLHFSYVFSVFPIFSVKLRVPFWFVDCMCCNLYVYIYICIQFFPFHLPFMVIDLLLAGTVHFPFVCCSCLFCPFTFCFWMFSFLSFAFDVFSLFIVCFYCFDMCPTHLTFYHCFVQLPVAVNMFSCGGGAELSMPLAISKTNIVYTFPFACHYPFIILSFLFMFKTSKHRLLHQVCHISLHIYIL